MLETNCREKVAGGRVARSVAIAASIFAFATIADAAVKVGEWMPIFQGVEEAHGEADAGEPRLQRVHAVRIDLQAPGIEFLSTPANGEQPLETTSETANEFLRRHRVQVAINANFFAPCCTPGDKDLSGLAISRGELVSAPISSGRGTAVLLITRDNQARIAEAAPVDLHDVWTAVAGSEVVLVGGAKPEFPKLTFQLTEHPRSAVGITKDRRYLILMVIDGRQPGYSIGAPMNDVADWLLRFGAHEGLNLDGGGSSALVREGEEAGIPIELNRPSGAGKPHGDERDLHVAMRKQRSNGNHLGVFARRLDSGSSPRTSHSR